MNQLMIETSDLAQSFIRKLIYFDIFSHPLSANELFEYCDIPEVNRKKGLRILKELKSRKLVSYDSGFYYLGDDHTKVLRRLEGNLLASLRMNDARKYAAIAAAFPFVRAVFISGSLSKMVMKPDSDIDFFIITEPGKLWVCRALLTIYKKLVLGNSHRNFCLNYFIDSCNLEIPDKNIFTATEIAFLIPMYNYPLYLKFMEKNGWICSEFPNFRVRTCDIDIKPGWEKRAGEKIFNNKVGNYLDELCYSVIVWYWKKKFHYMGERSFTLNFRSQKNVSKHHPHAFQERVVNRYKEMVGNFERSTGFPLVHYIEVKTMQ
jgi:hypothetical protein